jgi:hypothetical protein
MKRINKFSNPILIKRELYLIPFALFIMIVVQHYTKDKFKDGYQFLLSFFSIFPAIILYFKIQSLILIDIKRNPSQLNKGLKYPIYFMILWITSLPFLYLWGMRDVISQLNW